MELDSCEAQTPELVTLADLAAIDDLGGPTPRGAVRGVHGIGVAVDGACDQAIADQAGALQPRVRLEESVAVLVPPEPDVDGFEQLLGKLVQHPRVRRRRLVRGQVPRQILGLHVELREPREGSGHLVRQVHGLAHLCIRETQVCASREELVMRNHDRLQPLLLADAQLLMRPLHLVRCQERHDRLHLALQLFGAEGNHGEILQHTGVDTNDLPMVAAVHEVRGVLGAGFVDHLEEARAAVTVVVMIAGHLEEDRVRESGLHGLQPVVVGLARRPGVVGVAQVDHDVRLMLLQLSQHCGAFRGATSPVGQHADDQGFAIFGLR
mmetsp:Transcript_7877/g.15958  ORF Transcript_7877/g.15958 Transcript_7877/m.15958 type:complete len:323 (+) Transcript_7877:265-1233(+)